MRWKKILEDPNFSLVGFLYWSSWFGVLIILSLKGMEAGFGQFCLLPVLTLEDFVIKWGGRSSNFLIIYSFGFNLYWLEKSENFDCSEKFSNF